MVLDRAELEKFQESLPNLTTEHAITLITAFNVEVRQASELEESAFSCPNLPSDIVNRTLEGDIVYVSFGLPFFCTKPYAEVYTMLTTLKRESEMGLELSLQLPESLRSNYDKKVIMRREKQTARYVTMLDKLEGLKI